MATGIGTTRGRAGAGRPLPLHRVGHVPAGRGVTRRARNARCWSPGLLSGWTRDRATWSVIYATAAAAALLWLLLFGLR